MDNASFVEGDLTFVSLLSFALPGHKASILSWHFLWTEQWQTESIIQQSIKCRPLANAQGNLSELSRKCNHDFIQMDIYFASGRQQIAYVGTGIPVC